MYVPTNVWQTLLHFGPKLCGLLLPTCQTRSHSSMAVCPCSCLSSANIHTDTRTSTCACSSQMYTHRHTHRETTLPPALTSLFGSLKIKMTISHNFWMTFLKRRWAAEDFTFGPRSGRSERQRFNMHRGASNSWSVQTVKHTHTYGRSRARGSSRGKSSDKPVDYSINRVLFIQT